MLCTGDESHREQGRLQVSRSILSVCVYEEGGEEGGCCECV